MLFGHGRGLVQTMSYYNFVRRLEYRAVTTATKRLLFVIGLTALVATGFWTTSRYPALHEKAVMGGNTDLAGLGFDVLIPISATTSQIVLPLYHTINWLYTNLNGMVFGLLFGALLMTVLPLLKRYEIKNRFLGSAVGMLMGSPLGVCVNCATPIGQGLLAAGAPTEMALASLFSSPTLNIIVITMLFALFPAYIAFLKIGLTVGFIAICLPLVLKILRIPQTVSLDKSSSLWSKADQSIVDVHILEPYTQNEPWPMAAKWVLRNSVQNLWFLCKTAVPLMVLAGFIGSLAITFLPLDTLADAFPRTGRILSLVGMAFAALIGLLLPVPMAFDVIVTAVLMQSGLPLKYALVLLFTLGIFSIYPFTIIWRDVSKSLAINLVAILGIMGMLAGGVGHEFQQWRAVRYEKEVMFALGQVLDQPSDHSIVPTSDSVLSDSSRSAGNQFGASVLQPESVSRQNNLRIERVPFQEGVRTDEATQPTFVKHDGDTLGIEVQHRFRRMVLPEGFVMPGLASGDVHNDGWPDLLIIHDGAVSLYANQNGRTFRQQVAQTPKEGQFHPVVGALVDLDNDGWLDIWAAGYYGQHYVVYNDQGYFGNSSIQLLPNLDDVMLTIAATFGDIDRDSDLDLLLGNHSYVHTFGGMQTLTQRITQSPPTARNALLMNENTGFQVSAMPSIMGETLSVLFSDFDGDDASDLLVGNDYSTPDVYLRGDGDGGFRPIKHSEDVIPVSAHTTMSFAVADINNDLTPEIYVVQISTPQEWTVRSATEVCEELSDPSLQADCLQIAELVEVSGKARRSKDVTECLALTKLEEQQLCIGSNVLMGALMWHQDPAFCDLLAPRWPALAGACSASFKEYDEVDSALVEQLIPQKILENVLLVSTGDGRYVDRAAEMNLEYGGWGWNAKFADLDHDEWQDIYIVNGTLIQPRMTNLFLLNQQGKRFANRTEPSGLGSFLATMSYTYVDYDNDGDLDILAAPEFGPIAVYENRFARGNSIAIELRDNIGNSFGIGSKVVIYYGPNGERHQMREIQAGGGFLSFDAPGTHFGLGEHRSVSRLEIVWSTGERSTINDDFASGNRYIIYRQP